MSEPAPFTAYQRKLFVLLSVAVFFDGFDLIALSQVLPNLRADMGVSRFGAGLLVATVNLGTILAYVLVNRADRWGRKRVLTVTIAGYTTFTFLTAFSPNIYAFGALQLVARVFLIAEWATSMVIVAEEFPAARRGMVMGVVAATSSLGAVVCAGVAPVLLASAYGWRAVYFVGIVPLVIVAYARRQLRETERFDRLGEAARTRPLTEIVRGPYRRRVLLMGAIWFTGYICAQNTVTFWKDFAVNERGFTDGQVGAAVAVAALVSMPLVFMTGKLLDVLGRKRGAVVVFGVGSMSGVACYTLEGYWPLTVALVFGIYSSSAFLPVLNAFTTELFPTELRGDAFAWSNNLIGRWGYVLSPIAVGALAEDLGWGPVVSATAIFPIITAILIHRFLPETNQLELEQSAAV